MEDINKMMTDKEKKTAIGHTSQQKLAWNLSPLSLSFIVS